jgi:hypothetical protein
MLSRLIPIHFFRLSPIKPMRATITDWLLRQPFHTTYQIGRGCASEPLKFYISQYQNELTYRLAGPPRCPARVR